ncbi:putative bifunctional diguanylate cyclase/phosphodiesterase [Desulfurivibrio sp. D14AmB]|uniref:putative bifunctional diguanylate cyclase/phosphodiesterase n=1 Tax=Desulfurivibrio sp. D14AmB TaxID=3374370 RepID=UPI00376F1C43
MKTVEQLRAMSICVVDEDPARADLLCDTLAIEGRFGSVSRLDSAEALRQRVHPPNPFESPQPLDLVLLSESLPQGDSLETCALLDQSGIAPVVMMDAVEQWHDDQVARAFDAGAVDILFRPWSNPETVSRVYLALRLQQERLARRQREERLELELAERRIMEARLQYRATNDELTGLANRGQLERALELALIRAKNFQRPGALLYIDLDQFKLVNDTEGHDSGDRLLGQMAALLRRKVQPSHLAARIGSDEFAVLLEQTPRSTVFSLAEELRELFHSHCFEGRLGRYHLGASIGIALLAPNERLEGGELLARADQACHVAKIRGRNRVHCYDSTDPEVLGLQRDASWIPILREALKASNFSLVFQPIVQARGGICRHYEALVRLSQNGRLHGPGEFIPAAERVGLIHQIDLWVVEAAIDRLAALPPTDQPITLSINLSAYAFRNPDLMPLLERKLEMTGLAPSRLMFEVTETSAVTQLAQTRKLVERMRALGCRFALDDFGSGFSTFSYLKHFPVDLLKIDGGFVVNMLNNKTDELLVRSMVGLAHSLGKPVAAEFVENEATAQRLREIGVDYLQGYHLGRPQARFEPEPAVEFSSPEAAPLPVAPFAALAA